MILVNLLAASDIENFIQLNLIYKIGETYSKHYFCRVFTADIYLHENIEYYKNIYKQNKNENIYVNPATFFTDDKFNRTNMNIPNSSYVKALILIKHFDL